MSYEVFDDRTIEVLSIDDVLAGEHIIEFIDPTQYRDGAVLAVFNKAETWQGARVSINPRVEDVPADFMAWALDVSRRRMGYASSG